MNARQLEKQYRKAFNDPNFVYRPRQSDYAFQTTHVFAHLGARHPSRGDTTAIAYYKCRNCGEIFKHYYNSGRNIPNNTVCVKAVQRV